MNIKIFLSIFLPFGFSKSLTVSYFILYTRPRITDIQGHIFQDFFTKRSFEAESTGVKPCKFAVKNFKKQWDIFDITVNRNVLNSLASLISNVDSHIEDEDMKSDERHFGPMSGLKYKFRIHWNHSLPIMEHIINAM